jgi:NAD(P)-dependent dehydrogenase (short-subunit alcohol dehydrogenase family)
MARPELAVVNAAAVTLDLASQHSIGDGFAAAVAALGGIEILVNSAGRSLLRPAQDVTWDEWDTLMDVNLKGTYFLCGHLARHCIAEGKPGAIVSLSSTHGMAGLALRSVYGISKGGINQMTRALAIEWVEHGIRVNAVAPTTVLTAARRAFLPDGEVQDRARSRIPTKRFPEAGEVAAAVRYLVSDDAISVTGHILTVDGGLLAE